MREGLDDIVFGVAIITICILGLAGVYAAFTCGACASVAN